MALSDIRTINIQCTKCKELKNEKEFGAHKTKVNGKQSWCKSCQRESQRSEKAIERRKANHQKFKGEYNRDSRLRERQRYYHLKSLYGVTKQDYETMITEQNHSCLICGKREKENRDGKLCVDHCHRTGNVRGLLCHRCNTGLTFIEDSNFMKKAEEYLAMTTNKEVSNVA